MTTQEIYNDMQSGDNKKLWSYAKELVEFRRKKDKIKDVNVDFSDKEVVKQQVMEYLLQQTASGNAASAKELARLLGLDEATQDIVIETVDFAEATWEIG
jgi:hypothetical protein